VDHTETPTARHYTLRGLVQGVGLRPAVSRLAQRLNLAGFVRNASAGVEIHVEGDVSAVKAFDDQLQQHLPAPANLTHIDSVVCEPSGWDSFRIDVSNHEGSVSTRIPVDRAVCTDCIRDVQQESNRRHGYILTSCTQCGPRYSILEAMPYDRSRTSLKQFPLCAQCQQEDQNPLDRRFHAQTSSCPTCGPHVWLADPDDHVEDPIQCVVTAIETGRIVALRGVGGYQLLVDATNSQAVRSLRERKRRLTKPFAVMVQDISAAEQCAHINDLAAQQLESPENPIVLLPAKNGLICSEVQPGLNDIGIFLPTTPIHWMLTRVVDVPIVVTSGNLEGVPLAVTPQGAEEQLKDIADVWLHHNRDIIRPIDDSVVRMINQRAVTFRSARGLAPLPLPGIETMFSDCPDSVLAVGGHQKCAVALFNGQQAVLGPHLGDMESPAMRQRFVEHVASLQKVYASHNPVIAHDLHPDYFTTRWAQSNSQQLFPVQHHHAHVVSCMVDNNWLDKEVLGVAFDGTGYGSDGSIWGGEFLRAKVDTFQRIGHLHPFALLGGELAIHEPWRVAFTLIADAIGPVAACKYYQEAVPSQIPPQTLLKVLFSMTNSTLCTSAGRLFDGVAALILNAITSSAEGRPAMLLEAQVDLNTSTGYPFEVNTSQLVPQLDWRPMIRKLLIDRADQIPAGIMAARFHLGLAHGIAMLCQHLRKAGSLDVPVVLTGGVFQNKVLTELLVQEFEHMDIPHAVHQRIPPNDGGLAVGQLAVALAQGKCRSYDVVSNP